ncbi:hypothetical protein [Mesorhizobium sp. B1-1-8]|uniref:hypothetical protein n=1 Tax=Mesorhizobium sp. B1-1-8 TaxID=2589976 RepID=UPI00112999B7|nr:hypothetical protein [Mesorhizobium sp. B1-1-8]UCI05236.1 hypothetical protein FJ974_15335 [Mesorhizobium sp. B1-1-8]
MSGVVTTPAVWTAEKMVALPEPKRHLHSPSPVAPGFVAPIAPPHLSFTPIALAGAIARTATTQESAPIELLERRTGNALSDLEYLISDGPTFALSPNFEYLIDIERTHFAGQVGSGITHLVMESLGYNWRANADCLTATQEPHGDLLYGNGSVSRHGVVLTEAHGSFSARASAGHVRKECDDKYLRQVRPWVGEDSPHGKVIHGYSVAFGCKPKTAGASVALSETRINKPRRTADRPPAAEPGGEAPLAPTSMALTTHRSNFLLMGARPVAKWIDWLHGVGGAPADPGPVEFLVLEYAGRQFMASITPLVPVASLRWWFDEIYGHPFMWRHHPRHTDGSVVRQGSGWFVIERTAGERFLHELSGMIRGGRERQPARLDLPTFNPEGFGFGGEFAAIHPRRGEYEYAMFSDGLALLGTPKRDPIVRSVLWWPKDGVQ